MITFDYSKSLSFFASDEIFKLEPSVRNTHAILHNHSNAGKEFTGWIDWPLHYTNNPEYARIQQTAQQIIDQSDVLLVIGIGGSYLGSRAGIEMLTHSFYNQIPRHKRKTPEIYFLGTSLSSTYIRDLFDILDDKEISVNVISKSGTTTEPAIAFRIIKDYMEKRYGREEAQKRIFVTTDREKGALKQLAINEGYSSFVIPNNIGGRYSVLTPVGLLPIATAGIPIDEIMAGAQEGYHAFAQPELAYNSAYQYAVVRNLLYQKGKIIELLVNYEPSLHYLSEWWKQLFGEGEGKDHKGIFPASVQFTTDLHSLGQYIQDGLRNLFETVLHFSQSSSLVTIDKHEDDLDNLNYLTARSLHEINTLSMQAAVLAHVEGGVPNLRIELPELSPFYFGQMVYFFEKACALSGNLLGINPFDQPGVESYKRNMFTLLGKPGYD